MARSAVDTVGLELASGSPTLPEVANATSAVELGPPQGGLETFCCGPVRLQRGLSGLRERPESILRHEVSIPLLRP